MTQIQMSNYSFRVRRLLRRLACVLLPPILILISLFLLGTQLSEISTKNEIFSLSSFIILLSFSALAFNWCRVSTSFTSEDILKRIYQAGIDLFLASLLALLATFFAWLRMNPFFLPSFLFPVLLAMHWLFLAVAVLIFLLSILSMIRAIKEIGTPGKPPQ